MLDLFVIITFLGLMGLFGYLATKELKNNKECKKEESAPYKTEPVEERYVLVEELYVDQSPVEEEVEEELVPVTVKLNAISRKEGHNLNGMETYGDIEARLSKLSFEEFKELDEPDERPWTETEWNDPKNSGLKDIRKKTENGLFFRLKSDGTVNEDNAKILTREFMVPKSYVDSLPVIKK